MSPRACLYLKAYGPESRHDSALLRLAAAVDALEKEAGGGGFFFVRFADPRAHLRLRFMGTPSRVYGRRGRALMDKVAALLAPLRLKVHRAPYRPERVRYGGRAGLPLAESLFAADSRLALEWLKAGGKASGQAAAALGTAELMLRALGLSRAARDRFFRRYSADFMSREALPEASVPDAGPVSRIAAAAARGPEALARAGIAVPAGAMSEYLRRLRRIRRALGRAALSRPLEGLLAAYVHMHFNRFAVHGSLEWLCARLRAQPKRGGRS